ncbi:replication-associated protein [Capybara virus 37_cap1_578]|uniref:Replication-associated protein n=1 Tax=Capybara virus 37_cap1_578 TaxID=2585066 RepID=A0A514TRZ7_9VIRU|nr:replication-associated protein [Capybara virus 37_cap1_578]
MAPRRRATNWCFTINNPLPVDYDNLCARLDTADVNAKYWIAAREVGSGGTPHIQAFVSFRDRHDLHHVRDLIDPRGHYEIARGSASQNRSYCSKDGDFREGGTQPPAAAKKSRDDLGREFRVSISKGLGGILEFADTNPGVWYFSGHNLLRNSLAVMRPTERPSISVKWIYGAPGVGKSRFAHETLPNAYIKEPRTKWWNGYYGELECIIDDFGPGGIDINHLLRWFDRYKCLIENKGGMLPLNVVTFIITSNFHPRDIFKWGDEVHPQLPALERRCTMIHME